MPPIGAAEEAQMVCKGQGCRIENIAADYSSIAVVDSATAASIHFVVKDTNLQERLKGFQTGDAVECSGERKDNQTVLQAIAVKTVKVRPGRRLWVLASSTLAFLLMVGILSLFRPLELIVGEDGRYSNSKFQIALWFLILMIMYLSTLWLRAWDLGAEYLNGINIPSNLLLISGMSVLTFGAAKAITVGKVKDAVAAGDPDPKSEASKPNLLLDLTHNDGERGAAPRLDLGDVQMLVVTLVAACTYLAIIFHFLGSLEARKSISLPDVDTTILAAFGLGHGAYLTKKAVGEVGKS